MATEYESGEIAAFERTILDVLSICDKCKTAEEVKAQLVKKYDGDIPEYGKSKPTSYELKHCKCETHSYRGYNVDIFIDDNGQSYYTYLFNKCFSAGTYSPIEICKEMIEYEIDEYMDVKYRYEDKYRGASIRYDSSNKEDKNIYLFYKDRKIAELPSDLSITEMILYGQRILDTMAPALH